jgi:hypothetical protein
MLPYENVYLVMEDLRPSLRIAVKIESVVSFVDECPIDELPLPDRDRVTGKVDHVIYRVPIRHERSAA